ncbi:cation:proton antiporter [Candidatus Endobugula sertula]|uniref:Cation:proton antiporter n=1 Tax=Candidatus Endobugula sertula TaxID=62101 RepID=A0A1D2QU79_9GAMM|nr:cation:proton antiporter [Candidatus Endobugula sertula]
MNPLLALLPPLAAIPFILFFGERHKNLRELSIFIAGFVLLAINISIYQDYLEHQNVTSGSLNIFQGLTLELYAEPIGILFALLASFLWVVTTLYSIGYMRGHHERYQTRFYICFAVAIASVMAAAYAGNLLTLFIAYEAITLSTYPLVTHEGTEQAKRAGRIYLGLLMGGSIALLLPAIIAIWWLTGTLDFVAGGIIPADLMNPMWMTVLLALIVFGTGKAALMPFHSWLPNAMVAPTPVSALLHAVAVVKTGVFLILKVIVYIFGFNTLQQTGAASSLVTVAAITILLSSMIAMTKDNLKARLAYSTISQLAYIVLAALLANSVAVKGAGLHIITHAFGKITLFFCAGAIMVALHKKMISEFDGIGKQMPYTMAAFFIAALSIIGLPPLAGVWSKLAISEGAMVANEIWVVGVLMLSSLLNIAYLLPIPIRAFFAKSSEPNQATEIREAPLTCLMAIAITMLGCLVFFFWPGPVLGLLALVR